MFDALRPVPDPDRANAYTPSPLSLRLFTDQVSNLSDTDYPAPYTGGRWKILVIGSDQRYLETVGGKLFSTGNHPVETLLPMIHMHRAGFRFDVATLSGDAVAFEMWAMPGKDQTVTAFHARHLPQFERPHRLADIAAGLGPDSDYLGVFIPGGHGALMGLPDGPEVRAVLNWAAANDRFVISLCHGPAAFLALGEDNPWRGRKIVAFPDLVDNHTPKIGYMPGKLTWRFGEKLKAQGFVVTNRLTTGAVCQDGRLLTGDSPLASNALGKLTAAELLKATSTPA